MTLPSTKPFTSAAPAVISFRSICFGLLVVIWIGCWNTYSEYIAHTSRMNISHFPMALLCSYVLIVFGNQILRRFSQVTALNRNELLVVLTMGLVGAAVPAYGLTSFFLGMISVPYYRATPENQWADLVHPHLPSWLTPTNEGGAMRWLFEGLPQGYEIPWDVWTVPLFWWLSLIAAITIGCVAIATILRKQWSENERVTYPMLVPTVALAAAADAEPDDSLFAKRLFWIAFSLIFTIKAWNIISYFVPGFPRIWLGQQWLYFARYFPPQHTGVNFFTIGPKAPDLVREHSLGLTLLDIMMPGIHEIDLLKQLREIDSQFQGHYDYRSR